MVGEERIKEYLDRAKEIFGKELPRLQKAFDELMKAVRSGYLETKFEEVIPSKYKRLMLLAEAVVLRCEACIALHVKGAVEEGATKEEIIETLATCVLMGGGPALGYCGFALKCYEEFSEK